MAGGSIGGSLQVCTVMRATAAGMEALPIARMTDAVELPDDHSA